MNAPRVEHVTTAAQLSHARDLFRAYAASLPESAQISLRHQGFEAELAALPGKFASPGGCILLALLDGHAVGVVALRPLEPSGVLPGDATPACEMKRMYVRPEARCLGIGRSLCEELLRTARGRGYRTMKLDSEPDFLPAVNLYRSVGFVDAPRYNDDPVACTVWMSLVL
jgi:ribosomal protein S18 acetylase RimI-like enzyme